jgi:hypothetical protein
MRGCRAEKGLAGRKVGKDLRNLKSLDLLFPASIGVSSSLTLLRHIPNIAP